MNKKLVIVGASAFAEIAYEYFSHDSDYEVVAFSVEQAYLRDTELFGLPIVALENLTELYPPENYDCFIAITYIQLNQVRARLLKQVQKLGYHTPSYVSSQAFVWRNVEIGKNCFIFENNTVQPFVKLEDNVILWSGNHIGHHSLIKKNTFISSEVTISGNCEIGENTFIGVNATISNNVKIAAYNLIAMTAGIYKDTEEGFIYRSNPARKVPDKDPVEVFKHAV
jgi:sugar O-acyltransferase (sialic acid O-acetyltransferase NeuD family)